MATPQISVFTPTYNRSDKIHRVFNSLLQQTWKDFEWIIVDDGSSDNTKSVIEGFISARPFFTIRYHYQPNSGKHIAINTGLSMAEGTWFHIADSDDEMTPEALEVFMKTWNSVPDDKKALFCGVVACCKDQFGKRISDYVPNGVYDGGFREMFYQYKFRKEAVMINKTEVLKKFPFPDHIRNCYFPEAIIWKQMSAAYPVRFINDEIRIYYVDDGQSIMSSKPRHPKTKALSNCLESSQVLNNDFSYFKYAPAFFFRMAIVYHCFRPFLNADQRKWVFLRPAAKAFAWFFILPAAIYSSKLVADFNKLNKQ